MVCVSVSVSVGLSFCCLMSATISCGDFDALPSLECVKTSFADRNPAPKHTVPRLKKSYLANAKIISYKMGRLSINMDYFVNAARYT